MKKLLVTFTFFLGLAACKQVPLTGRKSLVLVPETTMQSLATSQYRSFISQNQVVKNTPDAQMLSRVGSRLSKSVIDYMKSKNLSSQLNGYTWEFNLINSPELNAWCMPGGKIVVYTGLLPVTANEAGLAAVIGHEIAHAVARHGSERMTQGLIAQGISIGGQVALNDNPRANQIFQQSFGIGGNLGILAFSRKHENEADKMGMIFMAMAGYDPKEAIEVWKRMASKSGPKPPEILSTHPSDQTRIKNLQEALKTAQVFYRPQ